MDNGASSYRRFLNGDEEAFHEIITEYRSGLIFFINRYLQDLAIAEDISIDVFTHLLVHPHSYNPKKASLKTYLYRVGRNKALDYIKHRKKITFTDLSAVDAELVDYHSLEEAVLADVQSRTVNAALQQLPQDMRIAVHLVYFENLSYNQAASVMKKSRKQIDNLLYRAKEQLRLLLGKEGLL